VPSFSTTLEQAIHGALALANARRHELATLEHLLLALIDEPDAARVSCGPARSIWTNCARR
jgi:ATP-dependent Clp protease ATP-binding subunit ClpA